MEVTNEYIHRQRGFFAKIDSRIKTKTSEEVRLFR